MRAYGWTSEQYDEQPQEVINVAEMIVAVEGEQQKKDADRAKMKQT